MKSVEKDINDNGSWFVRGYVDGEEVINFSKVKTSNWVIWETKLSTQDPYKLREALECKLEALAIVEGLS